MYTIQLYNGRCKGGIHCIHYNIRGICLIVGPMSIRVKCKRII